MAARIEPGIPSINPSTIPNVNSTPTSLVAENRLVHARHPASPQRPSHFEGATTRLCVLLRPLCQHLILLLLRQLQVLLAEESEARALRPGLPARVAAAHIALEAPGLPRNPVVLPGARCGQCGRDMFGEKLGEMVNENIEWMR